MNQSQVMTAFCRDYIDWYNKGTPSHEIFSISHGLCRMWMDYIVASDKVENGSEIHVYPELKDIFKSEYLDYLFPFNASRSEFTDEMLGKKSHLNEHRIKWVTEHALLENDDAK